MFWFRLQQPWALFCILHTTCLLFLNAAQDIGKVAADPKAQNGGKLSITIPQGDPLFSRYDAEQKIEANKSITNIKYTRSAFTRCACVGAMHAACGLCTNLQSDNISSTSQIAAVTVSFVNPVGLLLIPGMEIFFSHSHRGIIIWLAPSLAVVLCSAYHDLMLAGLQDWGPCCSPTADQQRHIVSGCLKHLRPEGENAQQTANR